MPGVPSGKGCEGCRQQKKKCDQCQPRCSRCVRLKLVCVGAGQQRYIFKLHDVSSGSSSSTSSRDVSRNESPCLARSISNGVTALAKSFIPIIHSTTSVNWNISYAYGDFMVFIPQRLGVNEALDASVRVLISAHSDLCRSRGADASNRTLALYGRAISTLRHTLDEKASASSTETLCACYLLIVCQAFVSNGEKSTFFSHSEGAVEIIRARGSKQPENEFERLLLLTLRGPIIFEAMMNPCIRLTTSEWNNLILDHISLEGPVNQILATIAEVPQFQKRGRSLKLHGVADDLLFDDLLERHSAMSSILDTMRVKLYNFEKELNGPADSDMHLLYQKIYGLALMPVLVLNCMIQALNISGDRMQAEAACLVHETVSLARNSHTYRPLGSAYIVLCLVLACGASTDPASMLLIEEQLQMYCCDFPSLRNLGRANAFRGTLRYLRLEEVDGAELRGY